MWQSRVADVEFPPTLPTDAAQWASRKPSYMVAGC